MEKDDVVIFSIGVLWEASKGSPKGCRQLERKACCDDARHDTQMGRFYSAGRSVVDENIHPIFESFCKSVQDIFCSSTEEVRSWKWCGTSNEERGSNFDNMAHFRGTMQLEQRGECNTSEKLSSKINFAWWASSAYGNAKTQTQEHPSPPIQQLYFSGDKKRAHISMVCMHIFSKSVWPHQRHYWQQARLTLLVMY